MWGLKIVFTRVLLWGISNGTWFLICYAILPRYHHYYIEGGRYVSYVHCRVSLLYPQPPIWISEKLGWVC